ncbi:MAG: JAB domain-containing protein [Eubacteriaceae bacterium]|jgi:DNA repair protein RadC|nr:JAB domain-containing protein [Eubacteriaceae bacterium]
MQYSDISTSLQKLDSKAAKNGISNLSTDELAALALRYPLEKASSAIEEAGGITSFLALNCDQTMELGIGKARAIAFRAAFELFAAKGKKKAGDQITCAIEAYGALSPNAKHAEQECFYAMLLNTKGVLISVELISIGILNASLVHAREVFRPAISRSAHSIILAHNHPSGDPMPSPEDFSVTNKIKKAGEILDIAVKDHIIFCDAAYYSFAEKRPFYL